MAWDDFSFDFSSPDSGSFLDNGGFSLYGGDSGSNNFDWGKGFDFGGFSPQISAPTQGFGGSFGQGSWLNSPAPNPYAGGYGTQSFLNPATLFGGAGALASLLGTLAGGGRGVTQTPMMTTPQKAQFEAAQRANAGLQPFMQGTTPLQMQQAQLLSAIANGQGLNQNYAKSVERAFEPQMGSLYNQATEAGRRRGFYDAPATSPAGGAVLGPGLADLQGQIAAAKLGLMQSLPGLYNQPIGQQIGAASGFANAQNNLFNAYPSGLRTQHPMWDQVGQGLGGALAGIGGAWAQNQQMQQQRDFQNQMLQMMSRSQSPYQFSGYSGY